MKIYHDLEPGSGPDAVALGCFDGLHAGHRAVIQEARGAGLLPTVLTFQPDIRGQGVKAGGELVSQPRKIALLEEMGVEQAYLLSFSRIRDMNAQAFVDALMSALRAKKLCCGFNFHFGRGGKAGVEALRELSTLYGAEVCVVPAVEIGGVPVSSTRIRTLVEAGEMEQAAELLGRPFSYDFPVAHGRKLGRKLGMPTINQPIPESFVLPRFGVYASMVRFGGNSYYGVTNVGVKPTVGAPGPLAETWMPEYSGPELYGEPVLMELLHFIRPEIKFESLEALKEQIALDASSAGRMLAADSFRCAESPCSKC